MKSTRFCQSCGGEIDQTAKFCEFCGAKVEKEQAVQEEPKQRLAMFVEDIFYIYRKGTVVTGMAQDTFGVGSLVENERTHQIYTIDGIEKYREKTNFVNPRDNCGLVFQSADKSEFRRGDKLLLK